SSGPGDDGPRCGRARHDLQGPARLSLEQVPGGQASGAVPHAALRALAEVRSRTAASRVTRLHKPAAAQAFRDCEEITFNAETAEAAEKKCPRISQRALRALQIGRASCRERVEIAVEVVGIKHRVK